MAPSTAVDFHVTVGSGLAQFGRSNVARQHLELAKGLAEQHELNAWYFKIERLLDGLATSPAMVASPEPDPTLSQHEFVLEVADGLRRHAVSAR